MKNVFSVALVALSIPTLGLGQVTSENNQRLKEGLKRYPEADANKDGVLTREEAAAFLKKRGQSGRGQNSKVHKPTAEEMKKVIAGGRVSPDGAKLKYEAGNGLRIVMTGHSWVAPGRKTLPQIAAAAGLDGHRQRSHTSGGGTGSANAIWLKEFGQWDGSAPRPVLVPAIATGEWDVMTWGGYYEDKQEYFTQWIDLCLEHNPKMRFFLQDGWPRYDPKFKGMEKEAILATQKKAYAGLRAGSHQAFFAAMAKKYPGKVHIIPAGAAVVDLTGRFYAGKVPDLDCVDEKTDGGKKGIYRDGGHLSRSSGTEWLVGYVYYGMLYGKSPQHLETLKPAGVPTALDRTLREVAWKAIIESPYSRITDKDGDGIADAASASRPAASSP